MPTTVTRPRKSKPKPPPNPVIFVELAPHLAHLKTRMEALARKHFRKLNAETCVAITEYLERHDAQDEEGADHA
jgi:hypothetical protein